MKTFNCQVLTQRKVIYDDYITSLVAPGLLGSFGVLAEHAPMISLLEQGTLVLKKEEKSHKINILHGVLDTRDSAVSILVEIEQ